MFEWLARVPMYVNRFGKPFGSQILFDRRCIVALDQTAGFVKHGTVPSIFARRVPVFAPARQWPISSTWVV